MSGAVDSWRGRHATLANGLCTWIINAKYGQGFAVSGSKSMLERVKRVQYTINVRIKRFSISRNQALGNAKSLSGESFEDIFQTNSILPNEHKVIALRNYSFVFCTTYYKFFLITSKIKINKLYRSILYCFCSLI